MGGMGEQCRNLLNCFSNEYFFDVIGSSEAGESHNASYSFFPSMRISSMAGKPDAISHTFLSQAVLVEKALSLPSRPDLIHAFDWSTFWAGRVLANHFSVPLVTTVQLSVEKHVKNVSPFQKIQHDMACCIEMSGLIEAASIIQVSESYAHSFHAFLLPKTTVIHNGINLVKYSNYNTVLLPGSKKKKLVYIGRFAEMKNVLSLLNANIPSEIDLIFIGDNRGGSNEIFDEMIHNVKSRDNLHFVGPKYGQEKIDYLCSADAVIVPSTHEPFGIVALEALASKSILLSSFVDGMSDFLNEETAINCGTTPESISAALEKLVNLTEEEKDKRIVNGLKICEEHDWKIQAAKLKTVYDKFL